MTSVHLRRGIRGPWLAWLVVVMPLLGEAAAQTDEPERPPFYAIRDARLVTGTGQVIDRGTIVLAEGLISGMGTEVDIPPEAWVIDGSGLTVYPGLIDALTHLGLEAEPAENGEPGRGGSERERPVIRGPEDRPATWTWKNAADLVRRRDGEIEVWRNAGFTSVMTVPSEGIFAGQAAFINLAGERSCNMVVHTPAALYVRFDSPAGSRSFPGSLMGILAYVRQVFFDAEHYQGAWSIYRASPKGLPRPTYDRTLEPVVRARKEGWPVLLPGSWAKEIARAIRLGETIGARTIIYGAHQGYEAVDRLRESKVPVLVSLKWPGRKEDADPDADIPLRVLELWDRAPSTPKACEDGGIRFAFFSDGLKTPKELLSNLRQALDAGLSEDAALRALTSSAAEICGVSDRTGSLEVGKIANLVVTQGDLFDEETKVKMVFVDGEKFVIRETEKTEPSSGKNIGGES